MSYWMPLWKSNDKLDGKQQHLIKFFWKNRNHALIFHTRRECREFINEHWGYIKFRKDLRAEPHGWRLPEAVKVDVFRVDTHEEQ